MNANNTRARLARLANPKSERAANRALINKARKNLYNARLAETNRVRRNAKANRNAKIKAVRNRHATLARVRGMNNALIVGYIKNVLGGRNFAGVTRQQIKNAILENKKNEIVVRAYINRYNKYLRGKVSLGARIRASGIKNGSLRAAQIKQGVKGLFYKPQFVAKAQAFRPFMRRGAIASSALNLNAQRAAAKNNTRPK